AGASRPAFPVGQLAGKAGAGGARSGIRRRGGRAPRLTHLRELCIGGAVGREPPHALDTARFRARLRGDLRCRRCRLPPDHRLRSRRRSGAALVGPRGGYHLAGGGSGSLRPRPGQPAAELARRLPAAVHAMRSDPFSPGCVLVTGGAGFIGSNLVRTLLHERRELRVIVLDALTYAGNVESLADVAAAYG